MTGKKKCSSNRDEGKSISKDINRRDTQDETDRLLAERDAELATVSKEIRLTDKIVLGGQLTHNWFDETDRSIFYFAFETRHPPGFPRNIEKFFESVFNRLSDPREKETFFREMENYILNPGFFAMPDDPLSPKVRDQTRAALIKAKKRAALKGESEHGAGDAPDKRRIVSTWPKIAEVLGCKKSKAIKLKDQLPLLPKVGKYTQAYEADLIAFRSRLPKK